MGRLAGFKYPEVVRRLHTFGFVFDRHGPGSREVWQHTATGRKVTVPHHTRDMAEGTLPRPTPRGRNRRRRLFVVVRQCNPEVS